jgi:hypothetical protein
LAYELNYQTSRTYFKGTLRANIDDTGPNAEGSPMSFSERSAEEPVVFDKGIVVYLMGIDGTWRRECKMQDASEHGATLTLDGSLEGLNLQEFVLLLSKTGLAYRRRELNWVRGEQIAVKFLAFKNKKKSASREETR